MVLADGDGAGAMADRASDAAGPVAAIFSQRVRRPGHTCRLRSATVLRRSQNPADRNEEIHL
jgi:hypothetical protein